MKFRHNQKQIIMKKRIKIKALVGTPFLISQQEIIGKGMFGTVCKAYHKEDPSKQLVVKIISLDSTNSESISSQLKSLKEIPSHPNLVNCQKLHISSQHNVYIIMEYCNGGSFQNYITRHTDIQEKNIWKFLSDFCRGYRILYDLHLIHRDIKPQNILIHNGTFKIADFGLVRKVNHHNITQNLSMKGTPLYMAPELKFEESGSSKVDVFSLGIVLYRLAFCGQYPFFSKDQQFETIDEYFQHEAKTELKFPKYPKRSERLKNLIEKMLEKNKQRRIEWKQIFSYEEIDLSEKKGEEKASKTFSQIDESMMIINRSTAKITVIDEPLNVRSSIENETQALIQFTQYTSSVQLFKLRQFIFKGKIIILIIKHLNKKLQAKCAVEQFHIHIMTLLKKIVASGVIYVLNLIDTIFQKIKKASPNLIAEEIDLIRVLTEQKKIFEEERKNLKLMNKSYVRLEYQNQLYDLLTQFTEYPQNIKENMKIPISFMIDLYDACLKLEAMKTEDSEFILEDTELDKIQMSSPKQFAEYLEGKIQTTLKDIQNGLQSLGLLFL